MPINARRPVREDFNDVLMDSHVGLFHGVDKEDASLIQELTGPPMEDREDFSDDCSVETFRAGEDLFPQGRNVKHIPIYVVLSGLFAVKHDYREREKTLIIGFDACGVVIGDVEWLLRNVPSPLIPRGVDKHGTQNASVAKATITAMTESEVLVISGDARRRLMESKIIAQNQARLLALKLLRRSARGDAIQVLKLFEVVAVLLQRLALSPQMGGVGISQHSAQATEEEWPIGYQNRLKCPIRHKDLAEALGVSVQTINTIFNTLTEKAWATYGKGGDIYLSDNFCSNDEAKRVRVVEGFAIWW